MFVPVRKLGINASPTVQRAASKTMPKTTPLSSGPTESISRLPSDSRMERICSCELLRGTTKAEVHERRLKGEHQD